MQPALFKEPLKDFLDIFGNLDFLGGFSNLTLKSGFNLNKKLMERNWNPKVFMCQYARKPKQMDYQNCDLFQISMTNGGFGYSFNQADFWDLYSSTWYTKEFAKIYRPKGVKMSDSDMESGWRNSKNNIYYPVQSGPENGLTVTVLIHIQYFT